MTAKRPQFRLFDFQVVNEDYDNYDEYREKKFLIKMFGMNTKTVVGMKLIKELHFGKVYLPLFINCIVTKVMNCMINLLRLIQQPIVNSLNC